MVQRITPAAARRMMEAGEGFPVDVREPSEYVTGHIPGGQTAAPGPDPYQGRPVIPDKEAPWLVYCRSGQRSAMAARQLEAMGYHNVYDLAGFWPGPIRWNGKNAGAQPPAYIMYRERER